MRGPDTDSRLVIPMQTEYCRRAAAEYLRHRHMMARIGKAILPLGGELFYLNRILTVRRHNDPVILCYHGVVPDEVAEDPQRDGNLVGNSEFSEQMGFIARTMTPICLSDLDGWLSGASILPKNPVLVTLDDGYRNNLHYAAPVLLKYGIPAVIFPTVGYIGTDRLLWPTEVYRSILLWPSSMVPLPDGSALAVPPNDVHKRRALAEWTREFCKTLSEESANAYLLHLRESNFPALTPNEIEMFSFLSWEETCRLHQLGFMIGSHTMDHSILTRVSAEHRRHELHESRQQLERHLNTSCICIAYPNGSPTDYSPQILSDVAQAGYKLGFTINAGACTRNTDPLTLSRICIPGKLSRLGYQSRISGLHDLLRSTLRHVSGSAGLFQASERISHSVNQTASSYQTGVDSSKLRAAGPKQAHPRMNL